EAGDLLAEGAVASSSRDPLARVLNIDHQLLLAELFNEFRRFGEVVEFLVEVDGDEVTLCGGSVAVDGAPERLLESAGLLAGNAHIADDAADPAPGHEDAPTLVPDLVELVEESLVILDVTELPFG